jgi:hypothetical protein
LVARPVLFPAPWAVDASECGARNVRPDLQIVARGLGGVLIAFTAGLRARPLPLADALEEPAATHFE